MKIAGEKNIINKLISGELYDATRNKKIRLPIRKLIIARNALEKILAIFDDTKFARPNISVAIVSDFITHDIAGAAIERALAKKYNITSIILPEDVKADSEALHEVECLSYGCKFIVAVGSGTINDLCKMASYKHGVEYGVFATAPSMNGYLSPTASIEMNGVKTSLKAHMPKLAVFDLDILAAAPKQLILSGLGDAICRSTVQADCLLSHYLIGTQYNKFIFDLLLEAEKNLLPEVKNLCKKGKNTKAILALTNALIVGGVAMWMSGSSAPASQGEHMICHFMESFFNDGAFTNLFANKNGIRNETTTKALSAVKFVPEAIKLDRSQPEFRKNFFAYRSKVINNQRVNKARAELEKNLSVLQQVENTFGVDKEFIVALWAVESNFGENMGGYYLPSVLATLAYEGRRHDFFKAELLNALKILDQGHINQNNFVGSWAGAMGQCQFIPSSFLKYATDYDGDGKKDIWQNKNDVFASIANYLKNVGWQKNGQYGRVVLLPSNFARFNISPEKTFTVHQLSKMGVKEYDGTKLKGNGSQRASIIDLTISDTGANSGEKRYIIIFDNYKTILDWNKSSYFATSVGILAELMK